MLKAGTAKLCVFATSSSWTPLINIHFSLGGYCAETGDGQPHDLTEPAVIPPMKNRWKKRKRMSTGMQPRMLIAIISFHS